MYNPSEARFRERMEVNAWERQEAQKKFGEWERRKERAADPLEPMITDDEDDWEYSRR